MGNGNGDTIRDRITGKITREGVSFSFSVVSIISVISAVGVLVATGFKPLAAAPVEHVAPKAVVKQLELVAKHAVDNTNRITKIETDQAVGEQRLINVEKDCQEIKSMQTEQRAMNQKFLEILLRVERNGN